MSIPNRPIRALAVLLIGSSTWWACGDSINPTPVDHVVVTPATALLDAAGETQQFTAVAQDADGKVIPGQTFSWQSSNDNVATINGSGLATALAEGSTSISATVDGVEDAAAVTVDFNDAPTAVIDNPSKDTTVTLGDAVDFQGTATDPDGSVDGHSWSFGDGGTSTVADPGAHTYANEGTYAVTYQVTDDAGAKSAPATVNVTVAANLPPTAVIDNPSRDTTVNVGTAVDFRGTATDLDGTIAAHSWGFGDGDAAAVEDPGAHVYGNAGVYTVTYSVTDDRGATSPDATVSVTVEQAPLSGRIVYSTYGGVNNGGLSVWGMFAMDVDGSNVSPVGTDLSTALSMAPAGSPDGQWVAYQRRDVPYPGSALTAVKISRADGTGGYELRGNPSAMPSWSRDGSRIALWADDWLSVVSPDGSNMVQLVQCPFLCEQAEPLLSPQAWSASGDSVYFSLIPDVYGIRPRVIYSVSVADGGVSKILDTGEPNRDNTDGVWDPAIAFDGWIAFTSDAWTGNPDVFLRDPAGTLYSLMHMSSAADYNPVWSPDGSQVAFVSDRDGSPKIYVLDASGLTQLTTHPEADTDPHWVPGTAAMPASVSASPSRHGMIRARLGGEGMWSPRE